MSNFYQARPTLAKLNQIRPNSNQIQPNLSAHFCAHFYRPSACNHLLFAPEKRPKSAPAERLPGCNCAAKLAQSASVSPKWRAQCTSYTCSLWLSSSQNEWPNGAPFGSSLAEVWPNFGHLQAPRAAQKWPLRIFLGGSAWTRPDCRLLFAHSPGRSTGLVAVEEPKWQGPTVGQSSGGERWPSERSGRSGREEEWRAELVQAPSECVCQLHVGQRRQSQARPKTN